MYGACVISVDNGRASTVAVLRTRCQLRVVGARAVIVLRPGCAPRCNSYRPDVTRVVLNEVMCA